MRYVSGLTSLVRTSFSWYSRRSVPSRSPQINDEFRGIPNPTAKEALDRTPSRIDQRFRDQSLVEAAIRLAIGEAKNGKRT
jgi:hypothetical protein